MKNICLVIIALLCINPKLSIGSDPRDDLLNGQYLIKWECKTADSNPTNHNKYLFAETMKDEEGVCVKAAEKVMPESIFSFQKNEQGFKIKNEKYNQYMYVAGHSHKEKTKSKLVLLYENVMSGSYFKIVRPDQEYQADNVFFIKNKRSGDYLCISTYWVGSTRDLKYNEYEDSMYGFFSFVPYTENFFKQD
ncbi:MAG: hypothetical protein J0H87_02715 [Holosporales bacterium]|nr:hypothetical protein [Holosporales bacterium]